MTLSISKTLAAALCLSTCVWGAASTPTAKSTGWVNVNPNGQARWVKAEVLKKYRKIQEFLSGVEQQYLEEIKTGIQSWSTVLPTFRNIAAGKAAMQGTGDQAAPKDNSKDYPQTSLTAYLRGQYQGKDPLTITQQLRSDTPFMERYNQRESIISITTPRLINGRRARPLERHGQTLNYLSMKPIECIMSKDMEQLVRQSLP